MMLCCSTSLGKEPNTVSRWRMVFVLVLVVGCQGPPTVTAGRIDVLNQADSAFTRADFSTASGLYERVLNTPPTGESGQTTSSINGFARFRDAVSLLQLGRQDDAKAQVDALQRDDATGPMARL